MRPSRRSASYQFNVPTLEVRESEILRPQSSGGWQCHTAMAASHGLNVTQAQTAMATKNSSVAGGPYSESRKMRTIDCFELPVRGRTLRILPEVGQVHTGNIRRSLTHRIEMAKQRGDRKLLNALESESRAIALL
ncbi:hypothetical protein [Phormidesmis priestleyi]